MNKARRKAISKILSEIEGLDINDKFEDLRSELETIKDEEEEAYNNLPESMQNGDKGEAMQAAIDSLDNAIQALSDIDEALTTLTGSLDEAVSN